MTIKDIAKESGYAIGTVSRVLNHHPNVSETARKRILEVIEAHNFTPNSNASHLKQSKSKGVAVVVKGAKNMLFTGIIEIIQEQMLSSGYTVSVNYLDENGDEVGYAKRYCREYKPLGLLFLGSNLKQFETEFQGIHVPCVLVTNRADGLEHENLSSVSTDDKLAACEAVSLLLRKGHRRIGLLGGDPRFSEASQARLAGSRQAFEEQNVPFAFEEQYEIARFSLRDGYDHMRRLLERMPDMTAAFAFSDVMALGALRALQDAGKAVPGDISLIGFDGIELTEFSNPRITTIRQDQEQLARRSTEILLERIENGGTAVRETVPFVLVEGESVAAL